MKTYTHRFVWILAAMAASEALVAQSSNGGSNSFVTVLAVSAVIITLFVLAQVAESLIQVEASKMGASTSGKSFGIVPSWKEMAGRKKPSYTEGKRVVVLDKGYDIKLRGASEKEVMVVPVKHFAIQPPNFRGIAPIPKLMVEIGQKVKVGDPVFFNKMTPDIHYVSPVSGEVIAINRGEKRAITEIVVRADDQQSHRKYTAPELGKAGREELVNFLLGSGVWPLINRRPFDKVPDPSEVPDNVFISTFSTAPMAVDRAFLLEGKEVEFHKGLEVLSHLTSGKVYLGLSAKGAEAPASVFSDAPHSEKVYFSGPHPAGNVGVHIHHISPIGAKGVVWTMTVQDVATLGGLFTKGEFDSSRLVALSGTPFVKPGYVRTYLGAKIEELVSENVRKEHVRFVSGDVLSGNAKESGGFVDWNSEQITALKEGDYHEMFGWLLPIKPRPSISRTFPNFLFGDMKFEADTNTHGERRAFVVTGQYESVLPMDIYVQHLMKAITYNDIEEMEGLGIRELTEEDVAICEFVCTSKQPLQQLLREGLTVLEEQS